MSTAATKARFVRTVHGQPGREDNELPSSGAHDRSLRPRTLDYFRLEFVLCGGIVESIPTKETKITPHKFKAIQGIERACLQQETEMCTTWSCEALSSTTVHLT